MSGFFSRLSLLTHICWSMWGFPKEDFNQNRIRFALSKTFKVYGIFDGRKWNFALVYYPQRCWPRSQQQQLKRLTMRRKMTNIEQLIFWCYIKCNYRIKTYNDFLHSALLIFFSLSAEVLCKPQIVHSHHHNFLCVYYQGNSNSFYNDYVPQAMAVFTKAFIFRVDPAATIPCFG